MTDDDNHRNVAMLKADGDEPILNDNWFDNDWNSENRVPLVRNSLRVKTALIESMRAALFVIAFASHRFVCRFHLKEGRAQHIVYDLSI